MCRWATGFHCANTCIIAWLTKLCVSLFFFFFFSKSLFFELKSDLLRKPVCFHLSCLHSHYYQFFLFVFRWKNYLLFLQFAFFVFRIVLSLEGFSGHHGKKTMIIIDKMDFPDPLRLRVVEKKNPSIFEKVWLKFWKEITILFFLLIIKNIKQLLNLKMRLEISPKSRDEIL